MVLSKMVLSKMRFIFVIFSIVLTLSLISASNVTVWQGQAYSGTGFESGDHSFNFTVYDSLTGGTDCYNNITTLTLGVWGQWKTEQYNVWVDCNDASTDYFLNINIDGIDQGARRRLTVQDFLRRDVSDIINGNLTANYGFFDYLGSLANRITKLWATDINISNDLEVGGNVTANYFKGDLEIDHLSGSSNTTIQNYIDSVQSAGRISGGEFTDNGDGTITVNAGVGFIKTANNEIGNTVFFNWAENTSVPLYNGSISKIFVDYNSGNPIIKRDGTLNHNTQTSLGTAFLCSLTGNVHILDGGQPGYNLARLVHYRFREPGIQKISGALLGEPDGLNLSVIEGVFWAGLNRFTTGSFDSTGASDNFTYYYQNGTSGWFIHEEISIINNTHYDDGSGTLAELTVNRYGVHWVYNDNDGHIFILYGYGDYTLGLAGNAEPPSTVPTILSEFGTLLGKIIVQKGDSNFTEILSILPEDISPSVVTEHGDLSGLGDDDHTQYLLADGTRAMTGNLNISDKNITKINCLLFSNGAEICGV